MSSGTPLLKYPQPKILLVDMDEKTETVLKSAGYNVSVGSFGNPYKVPQDDCFLPVIANGSLPSNASEQEIIVIDLAPHEILESPKGEKQVSMGEKDWWASCSRGFIDPKPKLMTAYREDFDRILEHGGVFVIFAIPKIYQKIKWAHKTFFDLRVDGEILEDNWSFLSAFKYLGINQSHGEEISSTTKALSPLLSEHINQAEYHCIFKPNKLSDSWLTFAENKFGEPVAGAIIRPESKGVVLIFPHFQDKSRFIVEFFNDFLPQLSPHLFPNLEGGRWIESPEYEIPQVIKLKKQIQEIEEEAQRKIVECQNAIDKERFENAYLYDLIRETGTPLVNAVKKTLAILGFQSIIDADEEMEKLGNAVQKREDLQVKDDSPILLVEVKGISGLPRDEALQAWKYLVPRMQEWNRTDIQALSIINHQRNLPPLERENNNPFREDNILNAQEHGFGLLTTWDLYRLTRSYIHNRWQHEYIKPLFYEKGRIEPLPKHYQFIGSVQRFIPEISVVGIQIEAGNLSIDDRIAFELTVTFEEQVVESLQFENKAVVQAEIGMLVGITTKLTKKQLKQGVRVFRLL
jgi:hypothetical protein